MQDEITRATTDALKLKLTGQAPRQPTQDTEAYDLYLQGMFFSNKSTEEGLRKSIEFFHRSLEKNPNSARAWAGIAKAWEWLADAYVKPIEAYPAMKAAAAKAIALDERNSDGHAYLGDAMRVRDWNTAGCLAELNRALELDPNSASAHLFLALGNTSLGNIEEGERHRLAAVKGDPLSPYVSNFSAFLLLATGRIDEAIAEAKRTLQIDPNYTYENSILAEAYRQKGMVSEAIELFKKAQENGVPQPGLALAYVQIGRQPEARQILEELKRLAVTKYFPAEQIAMVYVALGEKEEALQWLERAYDQHSGSLHSIAVQNRVFRPLYSDPRFAALLKRIGIDPEPVLARDKDRQ